MTDFIKTQTSFAYGEVAPEFYARDDINGLSRLENMDVLAGGGLSRRPGTEFVAALSRAGRLIPFSVDEDENYLLALTEKHILVFSNGERIQDLLTPWKYDTLATLQYAQRFGTMIFVHPDFEPLTLQKDGTTFKLRPFAFSRNDADVSINIPFMRFDDSDGIKITVTTNSMGNNYATFTTNEDFWTEDSVGSRIELNQKQWTVFSYDGPRSVTVYTDGTYSLPGGPVSDWRESAFSNRRGWPRSISFHQDRLVFGGSRSWPSGVWLSQVGRHNNFNVGTGLDDEAIFITLLSQQRQQICTVVSSDNLQILTSVGEWAISSKPLTPSSVDIKQHTSVGSLAARYLPPQKIEGATVFISGTQRDIRELSLDELGENYNATDLCAFSKHLMNGPVDVAYNDKLRQLFVVMQDGEIAVLNQNSGLGISAWARYRTDGAFRSVAVVDGETYVITERNNAFAIEKFSDNSLNDAGEYGFSFCAAALPLHASSHHPSRIRIRKIAARVMNTKTIFINGERAVLPNRIYADNSPGYTGDVYIRMLGSQYDCMSASWTIHSSEQLPATILSVTMHGRYTI